MKTWEMIKSLTESNKPFGELIFQTKEKDCTIICFLMPQVGRLEIWAYENDILDVNPIIYPSDEWIKVNKEDIKWLIF